MNNAEYENIWNTNLMAKSEPAEQHWVVEFGCTETVIRAGTYDEVNRPDDLGCPPVRIRPLSNVKLNPGQRVTNSDTESPYKTVRQLQQKHPAFSAGGIRALIFKEDSNGLRSCGAVLRIGRKVLIDEPKFIAWIHAQNRANGT